MRALWVLLLLGGAIQATPITTANPVAISGSGSESNGASHGSGIQVTASGTSGVDSVSFTLATWDGVSSFFCVCVGMTPYQIGSGATVNGVTGPWMSLFIQNGTGRLDVYDFTHNVIAHADLIGFVQITDTHPGLSTNETISVFSILSTDPATAPASVPEPTTGVLMFATLALFTASMLRRSWMSQRLSGQ